MWRKLNSILTYLICYTPLPRMMDADTQQCLNSQYSNNVSQVSQMGIVVSVAMVRNKHSPNMRISNSMRIWNSTNALFKQYDTSQDLPVKIPRGRYTPGICQPCLSDNKSVKHLPNILIAAQLLSRITTARHYI